MRGPNTSGWWDACSFSQAESASSRRHRTISFRPLTKLAVFRVKAVFSVCTAPTFSDKLLEYAVVPCATALDALAHEISCTAICATYCTTVCSQSSVWRHFLTCQQVANISSCAARCQLSVQLELSEHAQYRKDERHFFDEAYCEDRGSSTAFSDMSHLCIVLL
jgi:hypothetical protein